MFLCPLILPLEPRNLLKLVNLCIVIAIYEYFCFRCETLFKLIFFPKVSSVSGGGCRELNVASAKGEKSRALTDSLFSQIFFQGISFVQQLRKQVLI